MPHTGGDRFGGACRSSSLAPSLGVGHWSIWIIAVIAALAVGGLVGAFNGYLMAYSRHSGVHRHAWRPHRLCQGRGVLHLRRRHDCPARQDLQDHRRQRSRRMARTVLELDAGPDCVRLDRGRHFGWPPPAHAVQVSAEARVGRNLPRYTWKRSGAGRHGGGQCLSMAAQADRAICARTQRTHSRGRRGPCWSRRVHGRRAGRAMPGGAGLLHRLCRSRFSSRWPSGW